MDGHLCYFQRLVYIHVFNLGLYTIINSVFLSDDVCEHYFLKGDKLMDLCNEQEVSGNWQQALSFLNQAIGKYKKVLSTT